MNLPVTILDIETRSAVDLKKAGAHRYAEDASTAILCGSFKVGGGPLQHGHDQIQGLILAHNAQFERSVLNAKTPGLNLRPEQMDCTLARACAVGLPASLDQLGKVLGAPVQKDKEGHRLMLRLCRPRKVNADGSFEWWNDPSELERLAAYCDTDVLSECAVDARLPPLSERERRLWVLDQRINDRGFRVDVPAARHALSCVAEAKRRADRKIWELTNGAVTKCSQTAKVVAWIRSRGVPCESIAKGEIEEIVLKSELFDEPLVEEVVTLRRATSRMFRFDKILDQVCRDDRVRGVFQYHKAATGRWAGWTQSFPRVDSPEATQAVLDALASFAKPEKVVDWIELTEGPALKLLSQCLRPMVVAGPGKKLIGGDFSNIEGRVNAWIAGERWKVSAFRDFDLGQGADLYRVAYGRAFGVEPEAVGPTERQIGKVMELALGYGGGVGAFQNMAQVSGVRVPDERADALKRAWRDANPCIAASWHDLQDAAITAVESRGLVVSVLGDAVRYVCDGKFLYCRLPSGRTLHYASPTVGWKKHVLTIDGEKVEFDSLGVSYWGTDGGAWRQIDLYGGMQCNHIVQGFARDLLVEAMFAVEEAGYEIVMHTHDDLVCEVDESFGGAEEFAELMAEAARKMAPGLPVSVKAWEGDRWLK